MAGKVKQYTIVGSDKLLYAVLPVVKNPPEFPRDWFVRNKSKPITRVAGFGGSDPDPVKHIMGKFHLSDPVTNQEVTSALWVMMEKIEKMTLEEDWVSCGQLIGKKAAKIGPTDLIINNPPAATALTTSAADCVVGDAGRLGVLLYFHRMYMVCRLGRKEYTEKVKRRIRDVLQASPFNVPAGLLNGINEYGVGDEPEYKKLVAAIDMFLQMFPYHPWAGLRECTLSSRFRDCSALLAFEYIHRYLGLTDKTALLLWIHSMSVAIEIQKMFSRETEMGWPKGSYEPYLSDFGLCSKSPYSASTNPSLYLWIHAIGCLSGRTQSYLAKDFGHLNSSIVHSAVCVCVAFGTMPKPKGDGLPVGRDPLAWTKWYRENNHMCEPAYRKSIETMTLKAPRPGSMASALSRVFILFM